MDYQDLYNKADEAGNAAVKATIPEPMVIASETQKYFIPQGACGFAWVNVPGNCGFGRWLKAEGLAKKAYYGGVEIWISKFGQSIDYKTAYAEGFARVLKEAGIDACAGSRLD
jgi:hypothetical protein